MRLCPVFPALAMLSAAVACGLALPAHADTIFSNITNSCCQGPLVEGSNLGTESVAQAFTPGATYTMTGAQVLVFGFGGDTTFDAALYSNADGVPGTEIASLGTDLTGPGAGGVVNLSSPAVALLEGTEYWLVLSPYEASSDLVWAQGGSASAPLDEEGQGTSDVWLSSGSGSSQFAIDGTPTSSVTPEPSSIALLGTGLLGVAGVLRRRIA